MKTVKERMFKRGRAGCAGARALVSGIGLHAQCQTEREASCPVCSAQFLDVSSSPSDRQTLGLSLCVGCGWWHLHEDILFELDGNPGRKPARLWELHHAALDRIDLASDDLPIETLRNHLARYRDQLVHISAQQAEDLVASILAEHHGGEIVKLCAAAERLSPRLPTDHPEPLNRSSGPGVLLDLRGADAWLLVSGVNARFLALSQLSLLAH